MDGHAVDELLVDELLVNEPADGSDGGA